MARGDSLVRSGPSISRGHGSVHDMPYTEPLRDAVRRQRDIERAREKIQDTCALHDVAWGVPGGAGSSVEVTACVVYEGA